MHRAIVLLGARRVGKTVMLHQLTGALLESGVSPEQVLYASIEQPLLLSFSLAEIVELHLARHPQKDDTLYICLLYTSPSPRDATLSRMPSSA